MNLELVTIGTELLLGFTIDTNGAEIARVLAAQGVRVVRRTSVSDTGDEIRDAIESALRRTGAVLTTGGLGPTRDDITKHTVATLFDTPLEFDDTLWAALVERFARMGRVPAPSNRTQAEVPRGAVVLPNRWGTAPGLWLESDAKLVIMLPGVPREMRNLLAHEVVPRLAARSGAATIRSLVVRTTGIAESSLAERLGEIEPEIAPLTLAYLPGLGGVDLRLTAWQLAADDADRRLRDAAQRLYQRAGDHIYGEGEADLAALVLEQLQALGWRLGVAESCTGGLVGARLTEVPGSSAGFVGGVIAYDNAIKRAMLDVPGAVLDDHGAVSDAAVRAMAEGALRRLGTDVTVAITGIAGPDGGSDAKPVGTVWIGVSVDGQTAVNHVILPGNRHEIRARAAQLALFLVHRRLLSFQETRPMRHT